MTFHSLAASQPLALCCRRSGGHGVSPQKPEPRAGRAGLELAGHGVRTDTDRQRAEPSAEGAGSAPRGDGGASPIPFLSLEFLNLLSIR